MIQLAPPANDGSIIPEVGPWSADKHHFLRRYIDAFTTAMKKKKWAGLHYIDLFAGAGIERLEGSGQLDWGSPLIAAQARYKFQQLHLCDIDRKKVEALEARLARFPQPSPPQVLCGDSNERVGEIVVAIPARALSLAFIDPYGLHLHFETLGILATRRTDLIIFFPDHLDALRNCQFLYRDDPDSNLDKVLGTPDWRNTTDKTPRDRWANELSRIYVSQIQTLGYSHFDYERISMNGRPLYKLIFASRDKTGGDIWRRVQLQKPGGQATFDFH